MKERSFFWDPCKEDVTGLGPTRNRSSGETGTSERQLPHAETFDQFVTFSFTSRGPIQTGTSAHVQTFKSNWNVYHTPNRLRLTSYRNDENLFCMQRSSGMYPSRRGVKSITHLNVLRISKTGPIPMDSPADSAQRTLNLFLGSVVQ